MYDIQYSLHSLYFCILCMYRLRDEKLLNIDISRYVLVVVKLKLIIEWFILCEVFKASSNYSFS